MASKKFSELPPAQQGMLLALLPIVLAIVLFYDFALPLRGQAAQLESQEATLHAQNARGRLLEVQRARLTRKIASAQQQLSELREIVPDQPADDQFVRMLYDTARAASVHLRDLDASPPSRQRYFMEEPFHAQLDGTYYAVLDFFTRLATSQRIVNVTGLALSTVKSSGGSGSYKPSPGETVAATCVLTTFYSNGGAPPNGQGSGRAATAATRR